MKSEIYPSLKGFYILFGSEHEFRLRHALELSDKNYVVLCINKGYAILKKHN